jgi:hypothetical protein
MLEPVRVDALGRVYLWNVKGEWTETCPATRTADNDDGLAVAHRTQMNEENWGGKGGVVGGRDVFRFVLSWTAVAKLKMAAREAHVASNRPNIRPP